MNAISLRSSLNYAFLKTNVSRDAIDIFKAQASKLLNSLQNNEHESEEFHKNSLIDFLKETYYKDKHYINVKDKKDLVIHNDKSAQSTVGVIIEVKRPSNKAEMLSCDNINKKALQELVLYYLRERFLEKNLHIKHLIITNITEWFIFDARIFGSCFAENKELIKLFTEFEAKTLDKHKTEAFYKEIAEPAIALCQPNLTFTYINLANYKSLLESPPQQQDNDLIPLFKILTPEHLLKLSFSNDANSLNQEFYHELLHIIGLEEVKESGKNLIKRKKTTQRNPASFLEQSISKIKSRGEITQDDELFELAIELCITWINRILFLKLLEAQLLMYHQKDKAYQFFNGEKLTCFSDLNHLFFEVLALTEEQRDELTRQQFKAVPYLNSSLFERTELENKTFEISMLRRLSLPILSTTVLKNERGKKLTGELDILSYLFAFLEAYNFADDGKEEIKADNKSLISASVLGLIFEKINGYKDGSFFTPSIITMYMSRETVRLAVVQKFNEYKGWKCESFEDLQNRVEFGIVEQRKEANEIINSLKICDPAVGSGHFLVSVLNEIISIKSELKVLLDCDSNRLRDWEVRVFNDDLNIFQIDKKDEKFEYIFSSKNSRRVQAALFHEKQRLIENCLFGVDINPNSVKICRLRLWIELLKHAYYKEDGKLETLPNIDINIQVGNSLISRFKLNENLKKHQNNIEQYKKWIHVYQNVTDKAQKRLVEKSIIELKSIFFKGLSDDNAEKVKLNDLTAKLAELNNFSLIEESVQEKKQRENKIQKIESELSKISNKINDFQFNSVYDNAFEWRFEFPEALNESGDFLGFDVVIGNPPYIFARNSAEKGLTQESKSHFYNNFELAEYQVNLYPLFIELGHRLLKENGIFSCITPNNWLTINTNKKLRQFVLNQSSIKIVNFYTKVFDSAAVDSAIVLFKKAKENHNVTLMEYLGDFNVVKNATADAFLKQKDYLINIDYFKNKGAVALLDKIELNTVDLNSIADVKVGLGAYGINKGIPPQTKEMIKERTYHSKIKLSAEYIKYLEGSDVCRYFLFWSGEFLKYGKHLREPRKNFDLFSSKRILVRQIPSKLPFCINACLVEEVALNDRNSMNIINMKETPELILAVLNSKLISYWFVHKFGKMQRDTFPQFKINELAIFPIPKIFEPYRESLISLVNQVINAKKSGQNTNDLEKQIDSIVYALYALNDEEIAIIEKNR